MATTLVISSQWMRRLLSSMAVMILVFIVPSNGDVQFRQECTTEEKKIHPVLCSMVQHAHQDPVGMSTMLHDWAKSHGLLVGSTCADCADALVSRLLRVRAGSSAANATVNTDEDSQVNLSPTVPVVFAHGMGDSCFNSGFQSIVKHTSELLQGVYTICVPTGDTQEEDTTNGYFLNMDASVDVFAAKVAGDPKLANGFHAIGFSQGNNVIRGYIARYNSPAVRSFISVNGVNAGEGAVPYCRPELLSSTMQTHDLEFSMCDLLMEQASRVAYTEYAQQHSFQANYWRDPRDVEFPTYQKMAQLARWNNEGINGVNETLKENWAKTDQFIWVLAKQDGMVWPKEGEQWGAPDPGDPFQHILPREKTSWFKDDLFGLRTAEEAGKNHYESFDGDHLKFPMSEFDRWIRTYFG